MRAQTIYEIIGFQRGRDSRSALDIGMFTDQGQKKTKDQKWAEIELGQRVKWTSKVQHAMYIHDTIVTEDIKRLLDGSGTYVIPHEELFIPDRDILDVEIPDKYNHNIFGIWGEHEDEMYLIDTQGYNYTRYITHLVPPSGINENIEFKRGRGSKESLDIGDKIIQYEGKMAPYLDKIEEIAIRNGFVPDINPASDNDNGIYDEENQMTDYTIRNWIKPSKRFRRVKRTARVKIVLRILDNNSWRIEEFPKIHYLLFADPNHPIDKTPQSWKELASGDRFLEWTKDYKWFEEGII